jgi:hypothetical protein
VTARAPGILYSSSIVRRGQAKALIVNTAANTYFGKTAELLKIAKPKARQEHVMSAIVKYTMYVSITALAFVVLDAALTRVVDLLTIVRFALIFLMGSGPVALPAVFAIVLTVGAMQLARKKNVAITAMLASRREDKRCDRSCRDRLCKEPPGLRWPLWHVVQRYRDDQNMTLRQCVDTPSASNAGANKCRCVRTPSANRRTTPPIRKPMSGGTQGTSSKSSDNAIEGARSDQKLAATMTSAAKPKEASKYLRLTVFVKKTTAAPTAVKPHVKSVAIKA